MLGVLEVPFSAWAAVFVMDKLRSYGTVYMRGENSHPPFRRRKRAMLRFLRVRSLQKFVFVHAAVNNHFNSERPLSCRPIYKQNRAAALVE